MNGEAALEDALPADAPPGTCYRDLEGLHPCRHMDRVALIVVGEGRGAIRITSPRPHARPWFVESPTGPRLSFVDPAASPGATEGPSK